MTTIQVTIDLPEETYERAERFARLINRDLSSVLADTVVSSLPPLSHETDVLPVADMPDHAVLHLANSTLPAAQDKRLSELLEKQREGKLAVNEPQELEALMQKYNEGWLRKTAGLVEAVQRGLMEPPNS
ncbi:MAG: hypothetical protein AAFN40_09760 [Cyanobacteria bacterium J06560_6]